MSPAVRNFILKYIDSIETIEILLWLRSVRNEWKTAEQISVELRSNPSSVLKRLNALKSLQLVTENLKSHQYRYEPEKIEIDQAIQEFAEAYKLRPHKVFELVYSQKSQMKDFADAFVIGKYKKEEGE